MNTAVAILENNGAGGGEPLSRHHGGQLGQRHNCWIFSMDRFDKYIITTAPTPQPTYPYSLDWADLFFLVTYMLFLSKCLIVHYSNTCCTMKHRRCCKTLNHI